MDESQPTSAKFMSRRDRALAIVVLSIEPSLLYLIGEPENPGQVWKKLSDPFMKKTWVNKLELRQKLYSLHVPDLSFNLVSVSKVTEAGRVVKFLEKECQFINSQKQVIARASRHGSLYLLDCGSGEQRYAAKVSVNLWHKRYGHLNAQSLR